MVLGRNKVIGLKIFESLITYVNVVQSRIEMSDRFVVVYQASIYLGAMLKAMEPRVYILQE